MRRRRFLTGLAGAAALGLVAREAHAADRVTVVAEVDPLTTQVGEAVELTITVERLGEGAGIPDPVLPDLAALGIAVAGMPSSYRSSATMVLNGAVQRRATQTYSYTIIPSKPGSFSLPVHVMNGAVKIKAPRTPVLEVTGTAPVATPIAGGSGDPTVAQGDMFLWTRLDKPRAYVGEQLIYVLEVYERLPFPNIQLRALPGFQDFWSEELPEGEMRNETVAGVPYRVHPGLRRALFPQRAGTLTISAPEVGVGMRRRVSGRPTTVEVLPLPTEGRPANFSANNVGLYTIAAKVDRAKVKQGEPFTLTVTITGTGNIRVIDPGAWPELDGLRRYDPKAETRLNVGSQLGGERTYEFLMIPERAGKVQVPAHSFSFFDPATTKYQTVRTAPIVIAVVGDANAPAPSAEPAADAKAPKKAAKSGEDDLLAPLITPETLPRVGTTPSWLTPTRFTTGMILAPVVLLASMAARAVWRRVGPDDSSRASATRAARQKALISQCEAGVASGEGFYNALSQLLQALAVERAGPEGQGLPRRSLLELLARRGVSGDDVQRLGQLLDRCDAARFGGTGTDAAAGERRAILDDALTLVRRSSLTKKGAA